MRWLAQARGPRPTQRRAPAELTAIGRDVECAVLARAVRWHAERRVLIDRNKTVVFR